MTHFQANQRLVTSPLFASDVVAAKTRMHACLSTCPASRFTSEGDSNHEIEVGSS